MVCPGTSVSTQVLPWLRCCNLPHPCLRASPFAAAGFAGGSTAGFNVGADYNLGGPHTLGDMAAVEWAPNFITASPETLAASHTKMQLRAPLSRLGRPGAASAGGAAAAAAAAARCVECGVQAHA
jgi:hypothetical protein